MAFPNPSPVVHFAPTGATNTGAVNDLGVPSSSWTVQILASAGVTAGAVTILGSIDGATFSIITGAALTGKSGTSGTLTNGVVTFTGSGSVLVSAANAGNALRFLRADVTTTITGGTVTASSIGQV